ncbi:MAG TPA: hypothetical protein VGP36_22010 [Mycobacteriales bacterium]|nr:hypothetical protein [Mycobacteriales bacterium]
MADVLSSGYEPEYQGDGPPRRRRWTTLLAAGLVAAGAAYLAVHTGGGGAVRPPAATPLSVEVRPAPNPIRTGPPAPDARYRLDGDPGAGPAGLRLLVGGRHPAVLDARTGSLTPLPVPTVRGDVAELVHAGGVTAAVLHNAERLRARAVVLGRGGTAAQLGSVLDLVPMRDGTVLAEDCDGAGGTGPCTLTNFSTAGAVRWRRIVPRQLELVRDTPYGLLVRAYQGDLGGVARLENAQTGAVYRVIGRTYAVLGADDRQVVFEPAGCGSDCALTLTQLASGASRFLPENPGNPAVAAFSADGHQLAIGYAGMLPEDPSASAQRDGYVVVIDLVRADRWRTVPGLTTGAASTALPVWAPGGQLMLVTPTDGSGSGRVAAWTPGRPRLTLLPGGLTGFYGTAGLAAALT